MNKDKPGAFRSAPRMCLSDPVVPNSEASCFGVPRAGEMQGVSEWQMGLDEGIH